VCALKFNQKKIYIAVLDCVALNQTGQPPRMLKERTRKTALLRAQASQQTVLSGISFLQERVLGVGRRVKRAKPAEPLLVYIIQNFTFCYCSIIFETSLQEQYAMIRLQL